MRSKSCTSLHEESGLLSPRSGVGDSLTNSAALIHCRVSEAGKFRDSFQQDSVPKSRSLTYQGYSSSRRTTGSDLPVPPQGPERAAGAGDEEEESFERGDNDNHHVRVDPCHSAPKSLGQEFSYLTA